MSQFAGPARRVVLDVVVAVAATCLVPYALQDPPGPGYPGPVWVGWVVGAALGLPLLLRRRWSVPVLAWVVVVAAVATFLGIGGAGALWVMFAPVAVAVYTVANLADRIVTAAVALVAGIGAAAASLPHFYLVRVPAEARAGSVSGTSEVPLFWQFELGIAVVVIALAWASGRVVHMRRAAAAEFARRSAMQAVADERLRIARELHDVLGHTMSLIAVKATVASRLADRNPEHAKDALSTIEQTSRTAMVEIRRLLGVLRPASDDGDPSPLSPLPGSADLPALVERFRGPDLDVDLTLTGTDDLQPGVGLAVFRIVQEALTNVAEHSETRRCRVVVRGTADAVHVEITDDGPPRTTPRRRPGGGQGLIGMRERITAHGGALTVGPVTGGGFRVAAEIPRAEAEATP